MFYYTYKEFCDSTKKGCERMENYDYKELVKNLIDQMPNDGFMKQLYTIIMVHKRRAGK